MRIFPPRECFPGPSLNSRAELEKDTHIEKTESREKAGQKEKQAVPYRTGREARYLSVSTE